MVSLSRRKVLRGHGIGSCPRLVPYVPSAAQAARDWFLPPLRWFPPRLWLTWGRGPHAGLFAERGPVRHLSVT